MGLAPLFPAPSALTWSMDMASKAAAAVPSPGKGQENQDHQPPQCGNAEPAPAMVSPALLCEKPALPC